MRRTGCADALWALEALRGTLELFDGAPEGAPVLPAAPSQMEEFWGRGVPLNDLMEYYDLMVCLVVSLNTMDYHGISRNIEE